MKKGIFVSVVVASLVSVASASVDRMGMFSNSAAEIEEHMGTAAQEHTQDAKNSAQKHEKSENVQASKSDMSAVMENHYEQAQAYAQEAQEEAKEHRQEAQNEANEQREHAQEMANEAQEEAHNTAKEQRQEAMNEAKEHQQEAQNEANEHQQEAKEHKKSLLAFVQEEMDKAELPEEAKEVLHEVKKAVKFYKKEELFEDLNITSFEDLTKPEVKEEIQERLKKAQEVRAKEIAQNIIKDQPKAELPVAGEFVRFGDGQYDWVFVTKNGDVYKLAGVDPKTGNFSYEPLPGVQGSISKDGKVAFSAQGDDATAQALANKQMNGYPFAQYGDPNENGFDWVVVTQDGKLYKLEGFDPDTQSFVYTPVDGLVAEPQGDSVEVLPGT